MNRFQKSILWLWLAAMICFMLCFNRVEPNEVGIVRNHITRKVSIQPPGLYLSAPWIGVSTVPTNPLRVGVPTSGRGFSGKLIQFVPERADDFIAREGWRYYWMDNRFSFNFGNRNEFRGFRNIMLGYAYAKNQPSFIKVIEEYQ